jgi:type VI protein secretion system component Hcp
MKLLLLAASFACMLAPKAYAQYDIVVNTGGAVNCVASLTERGFSAFLWSVGGTVNVAVNGVLQPSRPNLSTIQITKNIDQCSSPQLQRSFFTGARFPTVVLTQYRTATQSVLPQPMAVVTLTDAILTQYSLSGSADSSATENLAFAFGKLCIRDYTYDSLGSGTSTQACYNVTTATESAMSILLNSKSQLLRQTK